MFTAFLYIKRITNKIHQKPKTNLRTIFLCNSYINFQNKKNLQNSKIHTPYKKNKKSQRVAHFMLVLFFNCLWKGKNELLI